MADICRCRMSACCACRDCNCNIVKTTCDHEGCPCHCKAMSTRCTCNTCICKIYAPENGVCVIDGCPCSCKTPVESPEVVLEAEEELVLQSLVTGVDSASVLVGAIPVPRSDDESSTAVEDLLAAEGIHSHNCACSSNCLCAYQNHCRQPGRKIPENEAVDGQCPCLCCRRFSCVIESPLVATVPVRKPMPQILVTPPFEEASGSFFEARSEELVTSKLLSENQAMSEAVTELLPLVRIPFYQPTHSDEQVAEYDVIIISSLNRAKGEVDDLGRVVNETIAPLHPSDAFETRYDASSSDDDTLDGSQFSDNPLSNTLLSSIVVTEVAPHYISILAPCVPGLILPPPEIKSTGQSTGIGFFTVSASQSPVSPTSQSKTSTEEETSALTSEPIVSKVFTETVPPSAEEATPSTSAASQVTRKQATASTSTPLSEAPGKQAMTSTPPLKGSGKPARTVPSTPPPKGPGKPAKTVSSTPPPKGPGKPAKTVHSTPPPKGSAKPAKTVPSTPPPKGSGKQAKTESSARKASGKQAPFEIPASTSKASSKEHTPVPVLSPVAAGQSPEATTRVPSSPLKRKLHRSSSDDESPPKIKPDATSPSSQIFRPSVESVPEEKLSDEEKAEHVPELIESDVTLLTPQDSPKSDDISQV